MFGIGAIILIVSLKLVSSQFAMDERCPSAFGLFPDRTSCSRYISCWAGRGFSLSCGRFLVFNPVTLTCQAGNTCPGKGLGAPPSGETVRLVNSPDPGTGMLQIRHEGHWSKVSNVNFDDTSASLTCKRMGYNSVSSWKVRSIPMDRIPTAVLTCSSWSKSVEQCTTKTCTSYTCGYADRTIFLSCQRESSSRCPTTSKGWIRWGNFCYLPRTNSRQTRLEADFFCSQLRGQLLTINSQLEHEFVNSILASSEIDVEYYTDGMSDELPSGDIMWAWHSKKFPLKYSKWWPGWNKTTSMKVKTKLVGSPSCLILKKLYPLKLEDLGKSRFHSEYDSEFYYFSASNCSASRSYVCKSTLTDVGCRHGIGTTYSGGANTSVSGKTCLQWSHPQLNNLLGRSARVSTPTNFNISLLGDHNFCRNPNGSPMPWCFTGMDRSEECDVPICQSPPFQSLIKKSTTVMATNTITTTPPMKLRPPILQPLNDDPRETKLELIAINKPTVMETVFKVRCKPNEYHCDSSSTCLKDDKICDGSRQCPRGDDEKFCKKYVAQMKLRSATSLVDKDVITTIYRKEVGVCAKKCLENPLCKAFIHYPRKRECDLVRSSVANSGVVRTTLSDVYEVPTRFGNCDNMIRCKNWKCIPKNLACDGKNDCGDNTDETGCPTLPEVTIRLVGAKENHAGNIQMKLRNEWKFVCDDKFGWKEADQICRDLDYDGAAQFTRNNRFGKNTKEFLRSEPSFWLSGLKCKGTENNILECSHNGIGHHDCGVTEIAGVVCRKGTQVCSKDQFQCNEKRTCIPRTHVCNGIMNCPDKSDEDPKLCSDYGVVKLVKPPNTPGETVGTVLVKHNEAWGSVCDDNFNEKHAKVICRSLGYESDWAVPYRKAHFGIGKGEVLIDEPGCLGHENIIEDCPAHKWGPGNCDHTEDVGVFCSDQPAIRLANGNTPNEGRIEIRLGKEWGTVCDDDFDDYDATVVCRMLGYPGGGIVQPSGLYGMGSGPVWLDSLDCRGEESDISKCRKSPPISSCSHREDVGIQCFTNNYFNLAKEIDRSLARKLPSSCGAHSATYNPFIDQNLAKIVGGRRIMRLDAPWLVSLQLKEKQTQKHNCGGVVLSEDYVLTAAHCFRNHNKRQYIVRVGEFDLNKEENSQEDFVIEKLWMHPEFDTTVEFNNDIALIKITRKFGKGIKIGRSVYPVCLPTYDADYSKAHDCTITGWGTTNEKSPPIPQNIPLAGNVKLYPVSLCLGKTSYKPFEITSSMVCAGQMDGSIDTCTGDSGGPMTCQIGGKHILYGITSWGKGCGRAGQPGMYTKVVKFLRWLDSILP